MTPEEFDEVYALKCMIQDRIFLMVEELSVGLNSDQKRALLELLSEGVRFQ